MSWFRTAPVAMAFALFSACAPGLDPMALAPVDDPEAASTHSDPVSAPLDGRNYVLDLIGAEIVQPPGLASLFASLDHDWLLFHVIGESETTLDLMVTRTSGAGAQDECAQVVPLPGVDWTSNPILALANARFDVSLDGRTVPLHEATFSAVVSDDGTRWDQGVLQATLDTRDLDPGVLPPDSDGCGYIETMGGACTPCIDGTRACTEVELDAMVALEVLYEFDTNPDPSTCGSVH